MSIKFHLLAALISAQRFSEYYFQRTMNLVSVPKNLGQKMADREREPKHFIIPFTEIKSRSR